MQIRLHKNATTTPAQRQYIQQNQHLNVSELARKFGVSATTIRKWRRRDSIYDESHVPKQISTALAPEQEIFVIFLRLALQLGLDDLLTLSHSIFCNGHIRPPDTTKHETKCSRASLNRCLTKYGISRLERLNKQVPFDLKDHQGTYLFYTTFRLPVDSEWKPRHLIHILLDCSSRWCHVEISPSFILKDSALLIDKVITAFPVKVLGIITCPKIEFKSNAGEIKQWNNPIKNHPMGLVESYCRNRNMIYYPLKTYHTETLGLLKLISFPKVTSPAAYREMIDTHLQHYNLTLRQRYLKIKARGKSSWNAMKFFPTVSNSDPIKSLSSPWECSNWVLPIQHL